MENEAVLINKYESIERCINRINEEYEITYFILFEMIIRNHTTG